MEERIWLLRRGGRTASFRTLDDGRVMYTLALRGEVEWCGPLSRELARATWENLASMGYVTLPTDDWT